MSQKLRDTKISVATTDGAATETVCTSDAIPDGSTVLLDLTLIGRNTVTGDSGACRGTAVAKRAAGGQVTVFVPPVLALTFAAGSEPALATCAMVLDVSGNALRLRATGVALHTIEWLGVMGLAIN